MNDDALATLRRDARRIFLAALHAAEPAPLVHAALLNAPELHRAEHVHILAVGKAAAGMATSALETLASRVASCTVVTSAASLETVQEMLDAHNVVSIAASHPLPDAASLAAGQRALHLLASNETRDPIVALISGGASSLMIAPPPSITIEDYRNVTALLQRAGASIDELNCVRKHIDLSKGGGLARAASGAPVVCLLVSDVIGNDPGVIASGPFAFDSTTFADALGVLDRHNLIGTAPKSVVEYLEAGIAQRAPETAKAGDAALANVRTQVLTDNAHALDAAASYARRIGYNTLRLHEPIAGNASDAGTSLAALMRKPDQPSCIIAGGETTVIVQHDGRGGRNQELALSAAIELEGTTDIVLLSGGTDGIDGSTDAAGAIVDGGSCARMRRNGVDPVTALERNDSWTALSASEDLLVTGPTGTNVMDVHILLRAAVER